MRAPSINRTWSGRQRQPTEGDRRRHRERAARRGRSTDDILLGVRHFGEQPACTHDEPLTRLGQAQTARRSIEEARPEPLLQSGNSARDSRRRHAEPSRCTGEACGLDDSHEHLHLAPAIHP